MASGTSAIIEIVAEGVVGLRLFGLGLPRDFCEKGSPADRFRESS